jgi:integrase
MQDQANQRRKLPTGIEERHARDCRSLNGGRCDCEPSYRAWVYDRRAKARIRKTFAGKGALSAAKGWRVDALSMQRRGQLQRETRRTVREVGDEWLEKTKRREVLSRSRVQFKPSTLRHYESALERYVYPDLGAVRLSDLRRSDVQALVDRLVGSGLSGSTVRNAIMPLRVIVRYAIRREGLLTNPTMDLELPEPGGRRERAATPVEAATILDALFEDDRALWATAFYAGLRRGELRALRVSDLRGLDGESVASIRVERAWDDVEGEVAPKSKASVREVPMPGTLRTILAEHVERQRRRGDDFVFGDAPRTPFVADTVRQRALRAWAASAVGAFLTGRPLPVELVPIGLHECRHSYSSFLDAAGVSETRADRYMGHSIRTVSGRYRHQLDGQLAEDAARLENYLAGAAVGKIVPLLAVEHG